MQPSKEYKFLQELIFEGVWPFNRIKSPQNVFLLLIVYSIWGLFLCIYYEILLEFFIAGVLGPLGLYFWTLGIFRYADKLRNVKIERINAVNKKFLIEFLEDLFHPSSLFIGVLVFTVVITYLFSSISSFENNFLNKLEAILHVESLPPFLLLFIILLSFDLCYRLGLSLYVILMQIRRNLRLKRYLKTPSLKSSFSPVDIRNLENADHSHFLTICSGITLIPLGFLDPFILFAISMYLFIALLLTMVNIIQLRLLFTFSFPSGLLLMLKSARLARIGTISPHKYPHTTPTLFVFNGRDIFIATSLRSQKVKNIMKTGEISVFIDSNDYKPFINSYGVLFVGRGKIYGTTVRMGILYSLIYAFRLVRIFFLFNKKYPLYISKYIKKNRYLPQSWQIIPILRRTIIEVIPDQIFFWKASRQTLVKY